MSEFPTNNDSLIRTNLILSLFSLLGSLTIITLYIWRKTLRSLVFTLVFFLSISELLNSIGNIMSVNKLMPEENLIVCNIQSVLINYTDFSSLFWMCIISHTIHNLMVREYEDTYKKRILFLIVGFGLPLIFTTIQTIVYYSTDDISPTIEYVVADCWCWIKDLEGNKWIVVGIYAVYWILIIGNFIIIFKVIAFLKRNCEMDDRNSQKIRKMINKLYLYPILSGVCFLFATVHRMYQLFVVRYSSTQLTEELVRLEIILYLFHGIFISFRGFLFFLIYGCDKKVMKEFEKIYNKFCAIFFRQNYKNSENLLTQNI